MSIYSISDLHLAMSVNKPMDVFGDKWSNYMERIKISWINEVGNDDYVIIPGDISWATYINDALEDFRFIDSLPGKKIISKGNHDYWWTTKSKLDKFKLGNKFDSIEFMHNNCFLLDDIILCGTRGWDCPGDASFENEDKKIFERELQRLELSLKSASIYGDEKPIVVALHYPPFNSQKQPSAFVDIMKKYNVTECIYGHLHGYGFKSAVQGNIEGINFKLVSADFLDFKPHRLFE